MVKNPPANAGEVRDSNLISRSGRCPVGEHGNPLQYSCPENPMDSWRTVHRVAKSRTRPSDLVHTHTHTEYICIYVDEC